MSQSLTVGCVPPSGAGDPVRSVERQAPCTVLTAVITSNTALAAMSGNVDFGASWILTTRCRMAGSQMHCTRRHVVTFHSRRLEPQPVPGPHAARHSDVLRDSGGALGVADGVGI